MSTSVSEESATSFFSLEQLSGLLDFWAVSTSLKKAKENTSFWNLNLFLFSIEVWEVPSLLGLLERANLSHWTPVSSF
jgi:hypothetical protein